MRMPVFSIRLTTAANTFSLANLVRQDQHQVAYELLATVFLIQAGDKILFCCAAHSTSGGNDIAFGLCTSKPVA